MGISMKSCKRCDNLARLLADERKNHEHTMSILRGVRIEMSSAKARTREVEKLIADAHATSPVVAKIFRKARRMVAGEEMEKRKK